MSHASFTVHNIVHIEASTGSTTGAPLCLLMRDRNYSYCTATVFTDNQTLTDALVKAINDAVAAHPAPAPDTAPARFRLTPADYRE